MKLIVKEKDILPYILVGMLIVSIILVSLPIRNKIELYFGFDLIAIVFFILFNFTIIHYWQKFPKPKGINNIKDLPQTNDIRTPSISYSGFIDRGTNISYIKFFIGDETIYLYYRNFFPMKHYYGPFIINSKENLSIGHFYIKDLKRINKYEARIEIESKNGETYYNFFMRNFTDNDYELLSESLRKISIS
ncbi:hypothetical protein [Chryseobacterium mucoviscidosis]|uniref:hypothetical protein n=1 Tax=Chryseobacterium mucoviscidosis TaxID=1945581 RepID=UPI0030184180